MKYINREIKFRAWEGNKMEYDIVVGKFGAFFVNKGQKGDGLDETDNASLTTFNTIYQKETPIMQYTGLKDRKGKEIYEGDILRWDTTGCGDEDIIDLITYDSDTARFSFGEGESMIFYEEMEIIGNIYENPELLTK